MTKNHFERWIKDPWVALDELKEEVRKRAGDLHGDADEILSEAGIDPDGMDEVEQLLAAAEVLYNDDNSDVLFYEFFSEPDELCYPIYEANIMGERSAESGSIKMTRTRSQVIVYTTGDWGVEERESYDVETFDINEVIRYFINEAEEYAAMDYPLVEEGEAEEEYPDYIRFYSYMDWIDPEPKKYVQTF